MTSVSSIPSTSTQNPPTIQPSGQPDAPVQRKQLTKAERRELQERQRAAKAAAAASGSTAKSPANTAKPSNPKAQAGQQSKVTMPVGATSSIAAISGGGGGAKKTAKSGKDADVVLGAGTMDKAAELEAHRKHQTRIFTHFVVPKKEGRLGVGIKGEVHPAIVRLGRQFADMKIVGANARCIATLVAFKTVCD